MRKVSVIIPTYNRVHMVTQAIESILTQSYEDFEIIVVDDGSTDNTQEVISRYVELHPQKIHYIFKQNGGCASARNAGIKAATGDFVAFLDSDDLYEPRKLELQVELLNMEQDCGFVYSDCIEFDEARNRSWIRRAAAFDCPEHFDVKCFMRPNADAHFGSFLFRRECIECIGGFDECFQYNEDSYFLQKIAIIFKVCYSDYPSLRARSHRSQKSRSRTNLIQTLLKNTEDILCEYPEFKQKLGTRAQQRLFQIRAALVVSLLFDGKYSAVIQEFHHISLLLFVVEVFHLFLRHICRAVSKRL